MHNQKVKATEMQSESVWLPKEKFCNGWELLRQKGDLGEQEQGLQVEVKYCDRGREQLGWQARKSNERGEGKVTVSGRGDVCSTRSLTKTGRKEYMNTSAVGRE